VSPVTRHSPVTSSLFLQVKYNRDLCKVILGIWSWSVLQFTMVFTATKAPRREGVSTVTPRGRLHGGGQHWRHVLYGRRGRHHNVHLHAGRPVPRVEDATHHQVRCLQLHQHVLHVQEHARLHATHVPTRRHSGQNSRSFRFISLFISFDDVFILTARCIRNCSTSG